jgi:hypothetical protein
MYLTEHKDYSGLNVLIPLSGGINSAAVLCELSDAPREYDPAELHLVYVHLREHSPDTFQFVADLIRFARKRFQNVFVRIKRESFLEFCRKEKFIPHPSVSPCSEHLKMDFLDSYQNQNNIDLDLIGYVREEYKRRYAKAQKHAPDRAMLFQIHARKEYPIKTIENEQCFEIVKAKIGWYPAIYDITENGKRIFMHNNCLPCKNMTEAQFDMVGKYYPGFHREAMQVSVELKRPWGRKTENICKACEF